MTDEFPGNSVRSRESRGRAPAEKVEETVNEKKIEPIEGIGQVTRRKESLGRRVRKSIFGGTTEGMWSYVTFEVLIPAARDTLMDAGEELLARILLPEGDRRASSRRRGGRGASTTPLGRIAYDQISARTQQTSRPRSERTPSSRSRARRDGFEFEEIVLQDRHIADEVLERMYFILDKYKLVTVADLYEILGETVDSTITDKWGWDNLLGSRVHRVSDGYLVDLPRPIPLDD